MNIRRYEPWSLFDLVQRDLLPLAGRRTALPDADNTVADWVPAVDIVEEKDRFDGAARPAMSLKASRG
jgi:hypothetical protein